MLQKICEHFDIPIRDIKVRGKAPYMERLIAFGKNALVRDHCNSFYARAFSFLIIVLYSKWPYMHLTMKSVVITENAILCQISNTLQSGTLHLQIETIIYGWTNTQILMR